MSQLYKKRKKDLRTIEISKPINVFRKFVISVWPIVLKHAESMAQIQNYGMKEYFNDWLQANWEMLVEASFDPSEGVLLEPYGEGADCNEIGSRVFRPSAIPTYRVICIPIDGRRFIDVLTGNEIDHPALFDSFCTIENEWLKDSPPFDHIVLQGDDTKVISVENVSFVAESI